MSVAKPVLSLAGKGKLATGSAATNQVISTHPHDNVTEKRCIDFESLNDILQKVFRHDGFRTELQRDAIEEACRFKRDLFVSLPTGSGKSLIYQLPAVYKNYGVTIVVSPLVALISNQISNAKKLGIPCATINSHMTKAWNQQVKDELLKPDTKLRLLYITPETLCSDYFQFFLNTMSRNKTLKLFAIDEAHCVSSWGHEFRPHYLKLGELRHKYPQIPIMALTATATTKVLQDILKVLNLENPRHFVASPFRSNLFYDVISDNQSEAKMLQELTVFLKNCLQIQVDNKKRPMKHGRVTAQKKVKTSESSGSSQFVSAATLLSCQPMAAEKSISSRKIPKKEILAKETFKITSFFKPKPVEVIDLCDSGNSNDLPSPKRGGGGSDDVEIIDFVEVKPKKVTQLEREACSNTHAGSFMTAINLISPTPSSSTVASKPQIETNLKSAGVGIVYCRTKLTCEDVAAYLDKKGVPAKPYHAGLKPKERSEIETLWMEEKVLVICATISFGMGIDKPNVRAVVHYNMSQSLANYYQESGRAGRDGKKAYCRLYYTPSDQNAIVFLLRKDMEELEVDSKAGNDVTAKKRHETAKAALERFERMVDYCKSMKRCRHLILAKEFALTETSQKSDNSKIDQFLKNGCGRSCDYCLLKSEMNGIKARR